MTAGDVTAPSDFYPRSPCGERRFLVFDIDYYKTSSIHALLAESDGAMAASITPTYISIHALLAESDANWFDLWGWKDYFYPRSPCGERR